MSTPVYKFKTRAARSLALIAYMPLFTLDVLMGGILGMIEAANDLRFRIKRAWSI